MRERVARVLAQHSSLCLDTEEERGVLVDALVASMHEHVDAWRIREFFSDAPTTGARVATLAASHGKVWGEVLDAACRLAGVPA